MSRRSRAHAQVPMPESDAPLRSTAAWLKESAGAVHRTDAHGAASRALREDRGFSLEAAQRRPVACRAAIRLARTGPPRTGRSRPRRRCEKYNASATKPSGTDRFKGFGCNIFAGFAGVGSGERRRGGSADALGRPVDAQAQRAEARRADVGRVLQLGLPRTEGAQGAAPAPTRGRAAKTAGSLWKPRSGARSHAGPQFASRA
jgi:hypothetical protein